MRLIRALPLLFWLVWSCNAQNGPTQPSVVLSWTQSTTTGVTGNCVYRGTVSGTYTMPAIFCSTTPATIYTDSTVTRGSTYFYAVTAKLGPSESGYSNEVKAAVPTIAPPTGAGAQETKLRLPGDYPYSQREQEAKRQLGLPHSAEAPLGEDIAGTGYDSHGGIIVSTRNSNHPQWQDFACDKDLVDCHEVPRAPALTAKVIWK